MIDRHRTLEAHLPSRPLSAFGVVTESPCLISVRVCAALSPLSLSLCSAVLALAPSCSQRYHLATVGAGCVRSRLEHLVRLYFWPASGCWLDRH